MVLLGFDLSDSFVTAADIYGHVVFHYDNGHILDIVATFNWYTIPQFHSPSQDYYLKLKHNLRLGKPFN